MILFKFPIQFLVCFNFNTFDQLAVIFPGGPFGAWCGIPVTTGFVYLVKLYSFLSKNVFDNTGEKHII